MADGLQRYWMMTAQKPPDERPGSVPQIRAKGDSVTFQFELMGIEQARLIIRCDADGNVWASIRAGQPEGG